jgi:hypothetical protein
VGSGIFVPLIVIFLIDEVLYSSARILYLVSIFGPGHSEFLRYYLPHRWRFTADSCPFPLPIGAHGFTQLGTFMRFRGARESEIGLEIEVPLDWGRGLYENVFCRDLTRGRKYLDILDSFYE